MFREWGLWQIVFSVIIGVYLIGMAVIDWKNKEIPLWPGVLCLGSLTLGQFISGQDWRFFLSGACVGVFLYIISRLSRGGIGEADALVYSITGLLLGFYHNMELLLISLFMAAIVGGYLMIVRHVGRKYKIAFVPFTALAYGVVVLL